MIASLLVEPGAYAQLQKLTCAQAEIQSGHFCQTLHIALDLSSCGKSGEAFTKYAVLECNEEDAIARFETSTAAYQVRLVLADSGKWQIRGPVLKEGKSRKIATIDDLPEVKIEPEVQTQNISQSIPQNSIKTSDLPAPPVQEELAKVDASKAELNKTAPDAIPEIEPKKSWFDIKGSTARIRGERHLYTTDWPSGTNTVNAPSNRTLFHIRVRPDFNLYASDSFKILIQPQITKIFGSYEYFINPTSGSTSPTQSSGVTIADPYFSVHQAYLNWKLSDTFEFTGGRMILKYGDELLIGAAEWGLIGRTFDGLRLKTQHGKGFGSTDVFVTKLGDGSAFAGYNNPLNTAAGGDITLYGVYSSWNLGQYMKNLDVYLLLQTDGYTASPEADLAVGGIRLKSEISGLDYKVEYTQQGGATYSDKGVYNPMGAESLQVEGEAGYTFDVDMKPRVGFSGFYAGSNYNQLYPSPHAWQGYADVLGRKNIRGFAAHLMFYPVKNFYVKLDYFVFQRPNLNFTPSNKSVGGSFFSQAKNPTDIGSVAASTSADLGNEIDFTAKFAVERYLNLTGGISVFNPGQYFRDCFGNLGPGLFYYLAIDATL